MAKSSAGELVPSSERDVKAEEDAIHRVNNEARAIYADYRRRLEEDPAFKALDEQTRYEFYVKAHYEFACANPIILRYIASFGMFSERANWLYLKQCYQRPIKSDADYCERQADFIMYVYKECTTLRGKGLKDLRAKALESITEEVDARALEMAKEQAARTVHANEVLAARRAALRAMVAAGDVSRALSGENSQKKTGDHPLE